MKPRRTTQGTIQRVPVVERFWSKVAVGEPNDCWLWTGPRRPNGYGYTTDFWKKILAHRLAYELTFGPIPPGLLILHSCDNPPCVNPTHLRVGTHKDNADDKASRGRARYTGAIEPLRGEANPRSKLTETEVVTIRSRYTPRPAGRPSKTNPVVGPTIRELAVEYGVSPSLIEAIVKRKTWAHLD